MYKGTLRSSGQAVAVKVQRPGVREQIAMDVFILRNLLAFVREWRKVNRRVTAEVAHLGWPENKPETNQPLLLTEAEYASHAS